MARVGAVTLRPGARQGSGGVSKLPGRLVHVPARDGGSLGGLLLAGAGPLSRLAGPVCSSCGLQKIGGQVKLAPADEQAEADPAVCPHPPILPLPSRPALAPVLPPHLSWCVL